MVDVLEGRGGDIDVINEERLNSPALVWAAYTGDLNTCRALLRYGASVKATDKVRQLPSS